MSDAKTHPIRFENLGLDQVLLRSLQRLGYESPTPIQAETIPLLLQGKDLVGQAQTGTGKTAAFALPILSQIDLSKKQPQVLVLAPTRELAIQVAEAFQTYARDLKGFHVLPIYGGQSYDTQLRQLRRGVHLVVGTPGRVMDHMRRGTLKLNSLKTLVLDEADEMLRMGFIDDVEWVLEQTPDSRQIVLFSATMPTAIRRIAKKHLNKPAEITIAKKTATAATIRQRFWSVSGVHKLDALTRILEAESFDAMLIFVRTKNETELLAEKLSARGYNAKALNGDIQQKQRERTVDQLKKGNIDILVATDVVARGLDVERISHVLNYDIPYDTEAYVHRIGRTGRAGRTGDAILFVAPRERRMLQAIERATRQKIEPMTLPSAKDINIHRVEKYKQRISDVLENENIKQFIKLLDEYTSEHEVPPLQIAAAMAFIAQDGQPLFLSEKAIKPAREWKDREPKGRRAAARDFDRKHKKKSLAAPGKGRQRYRLAVGYSHGVKPGNIVGAIANESDLDSKDIGQIDINGEYSTVDLPENLPKDIINTLKNTWVCNQKLKLSIYPERPNSTKRPKKPKRPKIKNKHK